MLDFAADPNRSYAPEPVTAGRADACAVREIVVRHPSDIPAALRADWQALAGVAAHPNSFAEPWFVDASLAYLAPDGGVRLLAVLDEDRLIGVALFAPAPRYGPVPLRHVRNWRHHNHFFGPPLIRRGEEVRFWQAVLAALDEARWASGFLHVSGLVDNGPIHRALAHAAAMSGRTCPVVHRERRPLLQSGLSAAEHYQANVSAKRRSELARRRKRLGELGQSRCASCGRRTRSSPGRRSSWRWRRADGRARRDRPWPPIRRLRVSLATSSAKRMPPAGSASSVSTSMTDPVAMLTTFLAPPGAFGFKCTFDEDYARFSPGILLQIENLKMLDRPDIAWTDSCAREDHPVAGLWSDWRSLVRVNVRLRGVSRLISYGGACLVEEGARLTAGLRRRGHA